MQKGEKAISVARDKAQTQKKLKKHLQDPTEKKGFFYILKSSKERVKYLKHVKCIKYKIGRMLIKDEDTRCRRKIYIEKLINE